MDSSLHLLIQYDKKLKTGQEPFQMYIGIFSENDSFLFKIVKFICIINTYVEQKQYKLYILYSS